jgi:hypothetical protein
MTLQLPIHVEGNPSVDFKISPSLAPFVTPPPSTSNLPSGDTQVSMQVTIPATLETGIVTGSIQAISAGSVAVMNLYLNVWDKQNVPGFQVALRVPPNLSALVSGDTVIYSTIPAANQTPLQVSSFSVRQFQNPQNLTISSFILQLDQDISQQNAFPVISPYDAAQGGVQSVPIPGALEAVVFRGLPDYTIHDEAYIRFNTVIVVISNISLDTMTFDQIVESVSLASLQ